MTKKIIDIALVIKTRGCKDFKVSTKKKAILVRF